MKYSHQSHTRGGRTEPTRRGKDLSPAASLRRLEQERELWTELLDRALEQNNSAEAVKCERGLARCKRGMDYCRGLLAEVQP